MTPKLTPPPRITDTGAATPCPDCGAARLFVSCGLFGAELVKVAMGEEGKMENRLNCRACGYTEGETAANRERVERRQGYRSKVE